MLEKFGFRSKVQAFDGLRKGNDITSHAI